MIDTEYIDISLRGLPRAFDGFQIVHVSDLHLPKRKSRILSLLDLIQAQAPDIIVSTGDILHNGAPLETSGLAAFYRGLSAICPVYAVTGNHELRTGGAAFWQDTLTARGVRPVGGRYERIEKDGDALAILGLEANTPYGADSFGNTRPIADLVKIALLHRPEYWRSCLSGEKAGPPDVTFCGHAHGGQVRLPRLGGLYAPGQGLFPSYTSGLYTVGERHMVVSRGLVAGRFPPRINNPPHLPVVTLRPAIWRCANR